MNRCGLWLGTLLLAVSASAQIVVMPGQETGIELKPELFGIQYHEHCYTDDGALSQLAPLDIHSVRLWVTPADFHPQPGEWQWENLDRQFAELAAAGYHPMPGIFQCEDWYTGSPETPWWLDEDAVAEWLLAVEAFVLRYGDRLSHVIIFDEVNVLHADQPYYMGFEKAAALYVDTARLIKSINPAVLTGGPSNFGGWENGHFASYVLALSEGADMLDFISSNIFLSWNENDADSLILHRSVWYEEAPLKINDMLGEAAPDELILDAYNASALWSKDGAPWTDPRNTNVVGGLVQGLTMLHSAMGGFTRILRWETLGGFGVLSWYPAYNALPPYFAWRLLTEQGGFSAGARMLACTTSAAPLPDAPHHSGMNVPVYMLQPFAFLDDEGRLRVVLINKSDADSTDVQVHSGSGWTQCRRFLFDADHAASCLDALELMPAADSPTVSCPPRSLTLLTFEQTVTSIDERCDAPCDDMMQIFPNPASARVNVKGPWPHGVCLHCRIYDMQGRLCREQRVTVGRGNGEIDVTALPSGQYIIELTGSQKRRTAPLTVLH